MPANGRKTNCRSAVSSRVARQPGVLSLFTGAGGLDLGLEAAGFATRLCVENDRDALRTLALSRPQWKIADPCDAVRFAADPLLAMSVAGIRRGDIVLLAGGPPCQPFSKASYWTQFGPAGMGDPRASSTIRAYLKIVAAVQPDVLLFENVAAFAFSNRSEGFASLVRGLHRINRERGTRYKPQLLRINAADYGVPQLRERVFIVAHSRGSMLKLPAPTHGPASADQRPYTTAWDAIGDLDGDIPELALQGRWSELLPSIPEGNNYLWHTPGNGGQPLFGWRTKYWSFLLKLAKVLPSWTISASPGPAAGPFHWRNRQLSTRELCRLQTFPDGYQIWGSRRAARRQIGNAVPSALAELIGLEIRRQLLGDLSAPTAASLAPGYRRGCPEPEPVRAVHRSYIGLRGAHKAHPGTGKGPAPQRRLTRTRGRGATRRKLAAAL
jgi:DNA (cytosine-5)-methyltransferase 1